MKRSVITICLFLASLNISYSQCGLTGMQSQMLKDSSFPILNASSSTLVVSIVNGNYPTTIGVEDSTPGVNEVDVLSANEAGNIVSSLFTALGVYEVEINNPGQGCVDTVQVAVVAPPCNVTPFPTQIELDSDFQFVNNENYSLSIDELTYSYPDAPGFDNDTDHTSGVFPARTINSNESLWMVAASTATLGIYDIQRTGIGGGCRDTVQVEIVVTLPVEWLQPVSAKKNKNSIEITFATAQQVNNSHFEIERSIDGRNFNKIGKIEGEGTTTNVNHYSFIDEKPLNGVNYYRVKQVDYDGRFDFSKIATVRFETDESIIYPNPSAGVLSVTSLQCQEMNIFNQLGEKVKVVLIEEGENIIDISTLSNGVYFLRFGDTTETIIKE